MSKPLLSAPAALLCLALAAAAQDVGDRPAVLKPKVLTSPAEAKRLEAVRLFGLATRHERGNRLVEAVRLFEKADALDPTTAAVPRSLFALYLAMDRSADAVKAADRVLALDPGDHVTAYHLSRHHRLGGRSKEAAAVLIIASKSPALADHPEQAAQIHYDLGAIREAEKDYPAAEKAFLAVTALLDDPRGMLASGKSPREEIVSQSADTWERVGRVRLKAGRTADAAKAFEAAVKLDDRRGPRLAYHLAQVQRDEGKPAEALASLDRYLATLPQGTDGYVMKAALLRKLSRGKEVVAALEGYSGRDPNNVGLRLMLANEYRLAGKADKAVAIYDDVSKTTVSPDLYRGLFALKADKGKAGVASVHAEFDAAVKAAAGDLSTPPDASAARRAKVMLEALKADKDLVRAMLPEALRAAKADESTHMTRGTMGTLAERAKEPATAEALYRTCLSKPANDTIESDATLGLLRALKAQQKHADIVEACRAGLKKALGVHRLLYHTELVWAHQALGKHDDAVAAADDGVKDADRLNTLRCRRIRVEALVQAGKAEKALAECKEMEKDYPSGGDLRDVRASTSSVLQALKRFEESERQLQLILEADPNDATANNDLGYNWADRGKNLEEAEKLIRKALELDRQAKATSVGPAAEEPDNAAFTDSLGWVLFRRGKLAEAAAELEKAAKLPGGDEDPTVWDHLGDVYSKMGKRDKAVECWKKSLDIYESGTRRRDDGRSKTIKDKIGPAAP